MAICPAKPLQLSYPKYYDVNAKFEYHGGAVGHSIDNFWALKFKVQSLGWLNFQEQKPSVKRIPLLGNTNTTVNVVMDEKNLSLVRHVIEINKPLNEVFRALFQAGLFEYEYRPVWFPC